MVNERIAAWWRRARPLLHPIGGGERLDPGELSRRLAAAMPLDLGRSFALPDEFARYLETIEPSSWLSQRIDRDFQLWPAATILRVTIHQVGVFDDDPALIRRAGAWIPFAQRGDRALRSHRPCAGASTSVHIAWLSAQSVSVTHWKSPSSCPFE